MSQEQAAHLQSQVAQLDTINWWHWIVHGFGAASLWAVSIYAKLKPPLTQKQEQEYMSELSQAKNNALHALGAFFSSLVASAPPAQAAVLSTAATSVTNAASSVQAAVPALAVAAANAAMNLVPQAVGFEPLADYVIDAIINELTARKSTAPVATTVEPVPTAAPASGFLGA